MLMVSRVYVIALQRACIPKYSLIPKRIIHNSGVKHPKNAVWDFRGLFRQLARITTVTTKTGNVTLRHASTVTKKSDRVVGLWLLTCSGMVFVAVALGGITRLTESGLSMVTWRFVGEKMPLTNIQWLEEFEKYKLYPEYQMLNKDMTLDDFKRIWWMEYLHRMWGRLIGVTFIMPMTYFWMRGMLKSGIKFKMMTLGTLIGLQGLMGWYMVKSGLEDRFTGPSDIPRVSQYRLAAHLGLALAIYAGFLYSALEHLFPANVMTLDWLCKKKLTVEVPIRLLKFKKLVYTTKGLIFITAISGAFVAGLDAGLIYNSFPKMAGKWIPDDIFAYWPFLRNFTENPSTVQFDHRILGISTLVMITILGFKSRGLKLPGSGSKAVLALICTGYLQVALGITTLLNHVAIPIAASHQSGSLLLLSSIVWLCHELKHVELAYKIRGFSMGIFTLILLLRGSFKPYKYSVQTCLGMIGFDTFHLYIDISCTGMNMILDGIWESTLFEGGTWNCDHQFYWA